MYDFFVDLFYGSKSSSQKKEMTPHRNILLYFNVNIMTRHKTKMCMSRVEFKGLLTVMIVEIMNVIFDTLKMCIAHQKILVYF